MNPALKQTAKPGRGRVLAIDYGRKRIGLAISDELGLTARPLETLERTNRRNDLRRLREIVRRHAVKSIVLGNPLRLDGSAGEMAAHASRFGAHLRRELRLPVEMQDERLSSWVARESTEKKKLVRDKRETDLDAVAAAVILKDFLDREQSRKPTRK